MEWANGDVRINMVRESAFSRIPERSSDHQSSGVARGPAAGEYTPQQTRIAMTGPPPQPPRDEYKVNPATGSYYPKTAPKTYGIVHPDYKQAASPSVPISKRYCEPPMPTYTLERQSDPQQQPQQHIVTASDYPSLQRGFTTTSSTGGSYSAPPSDDNCSSQVCAECPIGSAPCDYGPTDSSGYPIVDIRPGGCLPPEPPDAYAMELGGVTTVGTGPSVVMPTVTTDSRSVQSHVSHCDIRDFEEYRGLRGSRESLGSLPPDLQRHLQNCRCQCDHLGYGNYQTLMESGSRVSNISLTLSEAAAAVYGTRSHDDPTGASTSASSAPLGNPDYTQLNFQDSPRSTSSNGFPTRRKAPGELSPRHWWLVGLVFLVAVTAGVGVGVPLALRGDPSYALTKRLATARSILTEAPLIDGHNDLPWNIRSYIHNQLGELMLNESLKKVTPWSSSPWSHTDIPRLKEGMVGGQFWVAYTPCESQYKNSVQLTLEQVDLIKRVIRKYRDFMHLVTNSQDIMKVFKQGKMASMIGIEGGHSIGNSMGSLRMMYELGVRYLTLTHTCNTLWATSSIVESNQKQKMEYRGVGLSSFGKKVVLEMNRLGMMVDLSHCSTQTMRDALATTVAPVIFSHSAARALCDTPRNVPDDILRQIKINRGIVMVSFYADHISCAGQANVTHVADHINHIRNVAGIDYVGIGADFDGINKTPQDLEDVSAYPRLVAELLRNPTWSVADIRKLIGGNIIRVFSEVEKKRDELQAAGYLPQDEEIDQELLKKEGNCTYFPREQAT